jgi:DNA-binding MarR family transcriptional regulator
LPVAKAGAEVDTLTRSKKPDAQAEDEAPVRLDADVTDVMRLSADLQRGSARSLKNVWREKGLSERGIYILELVHAGLDRPSKLIEYFDVLPSTITFETDKLVAAGLITREALPTDRRVVQLSLTDEGRAVHRETTETVNAFLKPRLAALSRAELEAFVATFRKIVGVIPKVGQCADEKPQAAARPARRAAAGR